MGSPKQAAQMRAHLTSLVLAAAFGIVVGITIGGSPRGRVDAMSAPLSDFLVGLWRKVEREGCASRYPDEIEFLEGGVYLSRPAKDQGFVIWGGGDYEIIQPDRIKLQTQTDKMAPYELHATMNQLRFRDADGCEFTYQRAD